MSSDIIKLTIDGTVIKAKTGTKLLFAALDAGIYIPHLCAIRGTTPQAGCRLCMVEIEGRRRPTTACTEDVADGMVVCTNTEQIRRLQRTALELILASHPIDCKTCPANGTCSLQQIAAFLHIKLKQVRFRNRMPNLPIDDSHPSIGIDPNKCVICGKCIWACVEQKGIGAINWAFRGDRTVITPFGGDLLVNTRCDGDGLCADVCPVGAIWRKENGIPIPKKSYKTIE
jgi:formate dehydrogenase major subunit/NADH-quinone oxidoreductase subunit G